MCGFGLRARVCLWMDDYQYRPGCPRLALLASSRLAVIVFFQLLPCHSLVDSRFQRTQRPRASGNSQGLFSQLGARGGLLVLSSSSVSSGC